MKTFWMKFKFVADLSNGLAHFFWQNHTIFGKYKCSPFGSVSQVRHLFAKLFSAHHYFRMICSHLLTYCSQNLLVPTEHYLHIKLSAVNSTMNIARIRWMLMKWLFRIYFVHVRDFNLSNTSMGRLFYGFTISRFCLGFNFFNYSFSHPKGVNTKSIYA